MGIDWKEYDAFDWQASKQSPMEIDERAVVEELASRVLNISDADAVKVWGTASPPGRFASTVFRIEDDVTHAFASQAASRGIRSIGLKIYKANSDAQREFEKVRPFHNDEMHRLPGLPNERIQQSLRAFWEVDSRGDDRGIVIQQWVNGLTLDLLLQEQPQNGRLALDVVQGLLDQMFGEIVIPLWSAGLVWWDIRDANWCYDRVGGTLSLIDVDSLSAYADEILNRPMEWERRDKGRDTALSRLRQTVMRVFAAQVTRRRNKFEATLKSLWQSMLEPPLRALGHESYALHEAREALGRFIEEATAAASPRR
jgi:hypothetical protein